jgi:hypothetical protein
VRLTVRTCKLGGHPQYAVMLCDEKGNALPGQANVTLNTNAQGDAHIVIDFVIDGENIAMVGEHGTIR